MKKIFFPLVLILFLYLLHRSCPEIGENSLSLLLETNFFIPKESNVCNFRKTENGMGSGEGWIYGEDDTYYYGLNVWNELEPCSIYYILRKGEESKNFNKFDSKTWNKREGVKWMPEKFKSESYKRNCDK